MERPAVRGSGGHSVRGFWQAAAAGQPLVAYPRAGARTADLFARAVDEFSRPGTGPTGLVLDNASLQKACLVNARHAPWASRGVQRLFVPPDSPELHKIELLWHRCKQYWVRPEDYRSDDALRERIEYILTRVGTEYTVTFDSLLKIYGAYANGPPARCGHQASIKRAPTSRSELFGKGKSGTERSSGA